MRANLGATGGRLLAERVAGALPAAARDDVAAAARADGAFRDALLARPAIAAHLDEAQIDDLLDPAGYLGASGELIGRALARADRELGA
jgi:3-carboxy-cis,cis-muconate cycloisomerase